MKTENFNELRKLRNELAHGARTLDPVVLAKRLSEMGLSIPAAELPALIPTILRTLSSHAGVNHIPQTLVQVMAQLLEGKPARVICDPWAGLGVVVATVRELTHATRVLAFTQNEAELDLGQVLVKHAEWQVGDPLQLLRSLKGEIDVAASILPFGYRNDQSIIIQDPNGTPIELRGDFESLMLAMATTRLSAHGLGLFVVSSSIFYSKRSVLRKFSTAGLGMEAALALPSGTFASYTSIPTYLVVVRKRPTLQMFVGQLSSDAKTNRQIVANYIEHKEGGTLELGRFVDPMSFTGLESIRAAERFANMERRFGTPSVRLDELATTINLGRWGEDFRFLEQDNAVFIPLIGISNVSESLDDLRIKRHNYAQVAIDPTRSNARFVAGFLNSELGREIRELSKSGTVIPKLNKQTLKSLRLFLPDLRTQKAMLETEARIAAEQNTLFGLQNELSELQRELWISPLSAQSVDDRIGTFSHRLSGSIKQHADERLDHWFETLPFPLASILRAWQATPSQDFKTKHDHLLHFFEGTAEFTSVIFLSAFNSNESLFEAHRQSLTKAMGQMRLSFERATFGTWKFVVEYLGKQTRLLLSGDKDKRALCADMFADPSLALPEVLSRKELAEVFATTNKMRNDWGGHGGVVGQEEARLRNERLLGELQKLQSVIADTWGKVQLIHAHQSRLRHGLFENEVAVLTGSNSEFLKETRELSVCLDVERLYLSISESRTALKLLPLIRVGRSPESANNACYFFNRLESDGARFVSYHFADKPELTGRFDEAIEAIKSLTHS